MPNSTKGTGKLAPGNRSKVKIAAACITDQGGCCGLLRHGRHRNERTVTAVKLSSGRHIDEPSSFWPVVISMAQERMDLLLGSGVLGVLLLVAISGAFLWLAG
jgi:hypothetical protein